MPSVKSVAEEAFWDAWLAVAPDGHDVVRQYRFHPTRKWAADFGSQALKFLVEVEGRGRHQTVVGVRNDCEKYNEAARLRYFVYRFPATDYRQAADWAAFIIDAITQEPPCPRPTNSRSD